MDAILWAISIAMVLCLIAPQLVRERLVRKLRSRHLPLSSEVSDWFFGTSGYANAVKTRFIWGKRARELCEIEGMATYVWALRVIDIAKVVLLLVGFLVLFYELR
jgi:hypothetical protein